MFKKILSEIDTKEQDLSLGDTSLIEQSRIMIALLQEILVRVKEQVGISGFTDVVAEIEFFKEVKPMVLGKLIYYNNVYRIETTCPVRGGKLYRKYFEGQLKLLKQHNASQLDMDFYRYYRSGRTDKDADYFLREQVHYATVLDSFYFEMDSQYSTYYDHLVARFIAQDLTYVYILSRIDPETPVNFGSLDIPDDLQWTGTKNALIELIYALYISGVLSHGKIGVRKVSLIFQSLFKIPLGDIHHAFHRMKDRAGKRTIFIDQLRDSLEEYMDKHL
jgi:hypothetical protein